VFVLSYLYALNETPISVNCCGLYHSVVSAASSGGQVAVLRLSDNITFALCVLFHHPQPEEHRDADFFYCYMRNNGFGPQFFPFDSMACAGDFAGCFSFDAI
jgi:hypothetical protein